MQNNVLLAEGAILLVLMPLIKLLTGIVKKEDLPSMSIALLVTFASMFALSWIARTDVVTLKEDRNVHGIVLKTHYD